MKRKQVLKASYIRKLLEKYLDCGHKKFRVRYCNGRVLYKRLALVDGDLVEYLPRCEHQFKKFYLRNIVDIVPVDLGETISVKMFLEEFGKLRKLAAKCHPNLLISVDLSKISKVTDAELTSLLLCYDCNYQKVIEVLSQKYSPLVGRWFKSCSMRKVYLKSLSPVNDYSYECYQECINSLKSDLDNLRSAEYRWMSRFYYVGVFLDEVEFGGRKYLSGKVMLFTENLKSYRYYLVNDKLASFIEI